MSADNFYDQNAEEFYASTVDLDMGEFYRPFLAAIGEKPCRILDAGCGSGRDAKHFKDLGHVVTAFDASDELAKKASELLGQPVEVLTFEAMEFKPEFDAIWACASLLHVPKANMADVIDRCFKALKPDGIMYASFKYGRGEVERNGRTFTNYTEETVRSECFDDAKFSILKVWTTSDIRPDREAEKWVNVLVKKEGPSFWT